MSRVKDHIHRLKRHTYPNGTKVYFCTNDCSYKIEAAFALGKVVECNICGVEFKMNEYAVKLAKPHCAGCGKYKTMVDGKPKFVQKGRVVEALSDLGKTSADSMKERLGKVVVMEKDEDI